MYVSLGIFTQYRRELMGVATVLILLCHSLLPPAIHCPNDILRWIIITGNRGVDIFLFLSGLGNADFPYRPFPALRIYDCDDLPLSAGF